MDIKEKKITIGIDVRGKNFNHKAKHAVSSLRNSIKKHFRTENYVISVAANNFIWEKGRVNKPSKITLVGTVKDGKTYLFLDTKEDLKRKEELFVKKESKAKSTTSVGKAMEKIKAKKAEKTKKKVVEEKKVEKSKDNPKKK